MKITDVTVKRYSVSNDRHAVHIHLAAGLPNVQWIEYFMADNPLLLDQAVAAESLVRE